MGLFKKNANEAAYVGGKKHFTDVIKNSGAGELLVWRQPEEDFNDGSTLIVMPGEEAVFIKGGVIEQVFSNGTYILSTDNYPFVSRLRNARTGGVSTFNCVVYFVRKALSVEIQWGTDSPIQIRDKQLGITTKLRARGAYKLCVDNAGLFITKLLGNNIYFQDPQELDKYFFNEFQGKIKTVIAKTLNEQEEELLGVDARLEEFSGLITPFFQGILNGYGLKCVNFVVSAIEIEENANREKYDAAVIDAFAQLKQGDVSAANTVKQGKAETEVVIMKGQAEAQVKLQQGLVDAQILLAQKKAEKEIMDTMGDLGWTKQQAAEILKILAGNQGGGGVASVGAGFGMGVAMTGPFASLATQMISPLTSLSMSKDKVDNPVSSSRFEEQEEDAAEDPKKVLKDLKEWFEAGLITEEEYTQKRKEVLARIR